MVFDNFDEKFLRDPDENNSNGNFDLQQELKAAEQAKEEYSMLLRSARENQKAQLETYIRQAESEIARLLRLLK